MPEGEAAPAPPRIELEAVLESIEDGFVLLDAEWRYVYINKSAESMMGLSRADLLGRTCWEVFPDLWGSKHESLFRQTMGERTPGRVEEYDRKGRCCFETRTFPVRDGGIAIYFSDVTESKRWQETLLENELRYRTLFETTQDGILIVGDDGRYVDVNLSLCRMLKTTREQLVGQHFQSFIPPARVAEASEAFVSLQAGGSTPVEFPMLAADGTEVDLEWTSASNYLPGLHFCTCRDVAPRRRAEDALRKSEERLRVAQTAARVGIWYLSLNPDQENYWSPESYVISGFAESWKPDYADWLTRLHPEDRDEVHNTVQAAVEGSDESFTVVYRLRGMDGIERWQEARGSMRRDPAGRALGAIGVFLDVTERKAAEHALRDNEERLRSLVEATTVVLWTTSADGRFVGPLPSWERFTGQRWPEYAGWGGMQALHPEETDAVAAMWQAALRDRRPFEFEGRLWHAASGEFRYMICRAAPVLERSGAVREWVGCYEDIHERKRAEMALKQANAALQRANAALEQFAYAAAHDLQEPLRNIRLYTQLLQSRYSQSLDFEGIAFLDTVVGGASRMQSLIRDLLAYAAATEAREGVAGVRAEEAFASAKGNLHIAIEEAGATVQCGSLPAAAVHASHLTQLFQNLISNALKYRSAEPPRVRVEGERRGSWCEFRVIDNGEGIAPEHHARIFRIFKRLHGREVPGTGMGLAICERLVAHYGGEISVESSPGAGSTFRFTLPAAEG